MAKRKQAAAEPAATDSTAQGEPEPVETAQDEPEIEAYTDDAGRVCLMLSLDVEPGSDPPTRIRLLKRGDNPTTKGTLVYNDESIGAITTQLADHGRKQLPFDYGHGMLADAPSPDGGKAAAWFKPSPEADGLYCNDVEWTPYADNAIRNREYRFTSPAVVRDIKTGIVSRLVNVALTNLPATLGQQPLVAAETSTQPASEAVPAPTESPRMSTLLTLLGAETEEAAVAVLADRDAATVTLTAERDALVTKLAETEARSTALAAEVATLTAEKTAAAREQLIAQLSEAGKLPPALHDWARGISFEALSEFGAKVPGSDKPAPVQPSVAAVTLSDEDRAAMRAAHQTEEQFIAQRKAELSATR